MISTSRSVSNGNAVPQKRETTNKQRLEVPQTAPVCAQIKDCLCIYLHQDHIYAETLPALQFRKLLPVEEEIWLEETVRWLFFWGQQPELLLLILHTYPTVPLSLSQVSRSLQGEHLNRIYQESYHNWLPQKKVQTSEKHRNSVPSLQSLP